MNSRKPKRVLVGAMILMIGVTVSSCGKKSSQTNSELTQTVNEVTPTDEVNTTNTVAPTETSTPTQVPSTPTPTPIESKITTVTKPSLVEGLCEITSLSARDINEDSMIQEFDRVLDVRGFAEDMNLANVTSKDLLASLEGNTVLDAETKKVFEIVISAYDTNKIDIPRAALYTNLPKLRIEEGSFNTNRAVVFDPFNCIIYINTNIVKTEEEKKEAIKLGLGYASLEAYTEVNGEKFLCSPSILCYDANGNIVEQGGFAKNAVAQIIANKLDGKDAITPDDPNFYDILKFTAALNYINPNEPYTYEKYATDGYEPFAELVCQWLNPDDLLKAEDVCADFTPIDGSETEDKDFIAAYNFCKKLIEPDLDDLHNSNVAGGDHNVEVYYMKHLIDTFFNEIQGYNLEGEESFINALYLLTNNYR